ncbi:MAG: addiction module component CHP02574 family protein [Saprospiraceae bacterium]
MKVKILQDDNGEKSGVLISMEDWTLIKNNYPDVEQLMTGLPEWQKRIIDTRLDQLTVRPGILKPVSELIEELDKD